LGFVLEQTQKIYRLLGLGIKERKIAPAATQKIGATLSDLAPNF
jgi:hypothetical protein